MTEDKLKKIKAKKSAAQTEQKTRIEGLKVLPLKVNLDSRGYLFEIIHNYDMPKFGQIYVVGNPTKGTIRTFHKHKILWDYFCIIKGSAKFIFVDDRKDSPSFQQQETVVLSEKSPKLIFVPPGVYHGLMSLEDNTVMVSVATEVYNKEKPDEVRIPPDSFGNLWE